MEQDDVIKAYQEQTGGGKDDVVRPDSLPVQTAPQMKPGATNGQEKDKPEPRLRALEVNPDAKAMTRQERVDNCSGDSEEDGVLKPPCYNRSQVQEYAPELGQVWSGV